MKFIIKELDGIPYLVPRPKDPQVEKKNKKVGNEIRNKFYSKIGMFSSTLSKTQECPTISHNVEKQTHQSSTLGPQSGSNEKNSPSDTE